MPEIVIQAVGVAMEEALLTKWLKQPGDTIAVDDIVAEIETDKATMDIVSPYAGTLGPHLAAEGQIVPVGAAIVHVSDGTDQDADSNDQAAAAESTSETDHPGEAPADPDREQSNGHAPHRLSPRARRLAAQAAGTAEAATDASSEPSAASASTEATDGPPATSTADSRFRDLIAAKVSESWTQIPHFTVAREVGAQAILAQLEVLRAQGTEPTPTLTDLLLVALARAVGEDGPVDLGLAVATGHGVVIPVVRDVLAHTPAELARSRQAAVERARAGKLSQEDLSATPRSTLSNLGAFGVDRFTGIVAIGQTSLLTVGRARPRVVADEQGEISVQVMFDATLNADHRTVDGADAARVLVAFADAVENMTMTTEEGS